MDFFLFLDFYFFLYFFFCWIFFGFFCFLEILFKVTKVTKVTKSYQGYYWAPTIAKNGQKQHNKLSFLLEGQKKPRSKDEALRRNQK